AAAVGGHQRGGPDGAGDAARERDAGGRAPSPHRPRGRTGQRAAARRAAPARAGGAGGGPVSAVGEATLPLSDRTITEVAELLRSREVSSRELTEACLARIRRDGERLNTFLAVGEDRALAAADAADAALAAGEGADSPLLG